MQRREALQVWMNEEDGDHEGSHSLLPLDVCKNNISGGDPLHSTVVPTTPCESVKPDVALQSRERFFFKPWQRLKCIHFFHFTPTATLKILLKHIIPPAPIIKQGNHLGDRKLMIITCYQQLWENKVKGARQKVPYLSGVSGRTIVKIWKYRWQFKQVPGARQRII